MKTRSKSLALGLFFLAASCVVVDAQWSPQPIYSGNLNADPYRYNGMLWAGTPSVVWYNGSASLVDRRVALTAAHVIFNTENYTWFTNIRFALRHNVADTEPTGRTITGSRPMTSYSAILRADPDVSALALNSDSAALFTLVDMDTSFATPWVRDGAEASILTEELECLIIGYPTNAGYISPNQAGRMFQTGPHVWEFTRLEIDEEGETDAYNHPYGVFYAEDLLTVGGNSGGPIYVRDVDDDEQWVMAGTLSAGGLDGTEAYTMFRTIDADVASLMSSAMEAGGGSIRLPRTSLSVSIDGDGMPVLSWTDNCTGEDYWEIRRGDGDRWRVIGSVGPDTNSARDNEALPGTRYSYRVRACAYGSGSGSWSNIAVASGTTHGHRDDIARALGTPLFHFATGGRNPFFIDENGVRSGHIANETESWLELALTGPGVLSFDWSIDCEPSPSGELFDNMRVELGGSFQGHIHTRQNGTKTLTIPAGTQVVRWVYEKDPYAAEGADLGRISNLRYEAETSVRKLGGLAVGSQGYYYTPLFGYVFPYSNGWFYTFDLGHIYPEVSGDEVWMWSPDPAFGWFWTGGRAWPWVWSFESGWMAHMGGGWFYCDEPGLTGADYIKIGDRQ